MEINKAIARLQGSLDHNTILITRGDKDAVKLSIEALKRVKAYKEAHVGLHYEPMPGETAFAKEEE